MNPHRSWRVTILGIVLWLVIGGLAGYAAMVCGGHASGIFLVIGGLAGVSGAAFHIALHFVPRLRRSSWLAQSVTSWCGTLVLSVGAVLCFALATDHAADAVGMVGTLLPIAGLPTLLAAGVITWAIDLAG
ncbi:MAG: hypothetical protein K8T90_07090 [Planctomycetes bacterium]|nr:hypothetical protein [Planctomycetota bacterium]